MVAASLGAMAFFHLLGWSLLSLLWRKAPVHHRVALAFPAGFGGWGLLWIGLALAGGRGASPAGSATVLLALAGGGAVIGTAAMAAVRRIPSGGFAAAAWGLALLALSAVQLRLGHFELTWDSYYFVNRAQDIGAALANGYPLVALANANLSALVSADYYLFIVHPALALSLITGMVAAVLQWRRPADHPRPAPHEVLMGAVLAILFTNNRQVLWQAYYVNHHVLVACCFLWFSLVLLERRGMDAPTRGLLAFLSMVITVSRLEGFLFVLLALAVLVPRLRTRADRHQVVGVVLAANLPYLLYLVRALPGGSFVGAAQYVVMLGLGLVLYLAVRVRWLERLVRHGTDGLAVTAVMLAVVAVCVAAKPAHMALSIAGLAKNLLRLEEWGGATISVLVAVPLLAATRRVRGGRRSTRHDGLLHCFLSASLLIIALSVLRAPLSADPLDSANRMLLHFLPLAYVWVGIELRGLVAPTTRGFARPVRWSQAGR